MLTQITTEDYQKIKEIFAKALELPTVERENFLVVKCPDEKLREQVELLLKARDKAGDFLNNISAAVAVQQSLDKNEIGKVIDNYRIEGEIGRGGMGIVYEAVREDFHQQVALKLIKRGMDSDAIIERFSREREILATLNHPFIARLLDGGTTADGLPFFVMEYVEGVPVDEYCRNNTLSENEKLELFQKVCTAVSFAHQKLIIHRDLKPSNILVTPDGDPKLLDFGIAKLLNTSESVATQANMRVLTPAYASPEQMRGEPIGTTSDVYSLAVILSELLKTPNSKAKDSNHKDRTDLEIAGESLDPAPAKIFDFSSLNNDLQAIMQTSLREQAAERYSSVDQFSDDLRRYQKGLPVTAKKDSVSYRTKKFVQRNSLLVMVAALLILSLIGGLLGTLWQAGEARRERQIAQHERELAERRFNDVRQLANSFMFDIHDSIESLPGSTPARQLLVSRALEYLDKLAAESANDSALERELATAYEKIGKIQGNSYYSNLGDTEGAITSYRRSLEIRQNLVEADSTNPELKNELANSFEGMGDMFYTVNNLKEGLQNYENALAIRQSLTKSDAGNLNYLSAFAQINGKIGDIKGLDGYPNLGDTDGALEAYQKTTAISEQISKQVPDNEKYKYEFAQRLQNLGVMLGTVGRTKEAIASGEKAHDLYVTLVAQNPNNTEYALNKLSNLIFLRVVLSEDVRHADAVERAREAVAGLEKMQTIDPQNSFIRRSLGVSLNALGRSLFFLNDFQGALKNHQQALAIAEKQVEADTSSAEKKQDVVNALQCLADAQLAVHDFQAALVNQHRAETLLNEMIDKDSSDSRLKSSLSISLAGIGNALKATGNYQMALEIFQKASLLGEEASQKSPSNARIKSRMALRYFEIAELYERMQQTEQARNWYEKSFIVWNAMKETGVLNKLEAKHLENVSASLKKYNQNH
jgi:serine/threonine protein kinase